MLITNVHFVQWRVAKKDVSRRMPRFFTNSVFVFTSCQKNSKIGCDFGRIHKAGDKYDIDYFALFE